MGKTGADGCLQTVKGVRMAVEKIRENKASLGIKGAIDEAINSIPVNFEIRQFLIGHSDQTRIYAKGACMRRRQP